MCRCSAGLVSKSLCRDSTINERVAQILEGLHRQSHKLPSVHLTALPQRLEYSPLRIVHRIRHRALPLLRPRCPVRVSVLHLHARMTISDSWRIVDYLRHRTGFRCGRSGSGIESCSSLLARRRESCSEIGISSRRSWTRCKRFCFLCDRARSSYAASNGGWTGESEYRREVENRGERIRRPLRRNCAEGTREGAGSISLAGNRNRARVGKRKP